MTESEQLTEMWKQGKLQSGWYYVRLIRGEYRIDLYIANKNEWIDCPDNIIDTVVCEVPSCEQWKMTKNLSERAHLEMYKARGEKVRLEKENTKLKELLKECSPYISRSATSRMIKNSAGYKKDTKLLEKINQVLGEE